MKSAKILQHPRLLGRAVDILKSVHDRHQALAQDLDALASAFDAKRALPDMAGIIASMHDNLDRLDGLMDEMDLALSVPGTGSSADTELYSALQKQGESLRVDWESLCRRARRVLMAIGVDGR